MSVPGAERINRSAPAAMDCHWGCQGRRTLGKSDRMGGGAAGGATGPIPNQFCSRDLKLPSSLLRAWMMMMMYSSILSSEEYIIIIIIIIIIIQAPGTLNCQALNKLPTGGQHLKKIITPKNTRSLKNTDCRKMDLTRSAAHRSY